MCAKLVRIWSLVATELPNLGSDIIPYQSLHAYSSRNSYVFFKWATSWMTLGSQLNKTAACVDAPIPFRDLFSLFCQYIPPSLSLKHHFLLSSRKTTLPHQRNSRRLINAACIWRCALSHFQHLLQSWRLNSTPQHCHQSHVSQTAINSNARWKIIPFLPTKNTISETMQAYGHVCAR